MDLKSSIRAGSLAVVAAVAFAAHGTARQSDRQYVNLLAIIGEPYRKVVQADLGKVCSREYVGEYRSGTTLLQLSRLTEATVASSPSPLHLHHVGFVKGKRWSGVWFQEGKARAVYFDGGEHTEPWQIVVKAQVGIDTNHWNVARSLRGSMVSGPESAFDLSLGSKPKVYVELSRLYLSSSAKPGKSYHLTYTVGDATLQSWKYEGERVVLTVTDGKSRVEVSRLGLSVESLLAGLGVKAEDIDLRQTYDGGEAATGTWQVNFRTGPLKGKQATIDKLDTRLTLSLHNS